MQYSFRIRIHLTYRDEYSYSEKKNEYETNPIPNCTTVPYRSKNFLGPNPYMWRVWRYGVHICTEDGLRSVPTCFFPRTSGTGGLISPCNITFYVHKPYMKVVRKHLIFPNLHRNCKFVPLDQKLLPLSRK